MRAAGPSASPVTSKRYGYALAASWAVPVHVPLASAVRVTKGAVQSVVVPKAPMTLTAVTPSHWGV